MLWNSSEPRLQREIVALKQKNCLTGILTRKLGFNHALAIAFISWIKGAILLCLLWTYGNGLRKVKNLLQTTHIKTSCVADLADNLSICLLAWCFFDTFVRGDLTQATVSLSHCSVCLLSYLYFLDFKLSSGLQIYVGLLFTQLPKAVYSHVISEKVSHLTSPPVINNNNVYVIL